MMRKTDYYLVPDVHGRTFWKDLPRYMYDRGEHVVFLGDYMDPYPTEGITYEQALANFDEIIDFAKSHKNVTLLLGNHDVPYYDHRYFPLGNNRYDAEHADEIASRFAANRSLYKWAKVVEVGGCEVLLSHSCVERRWLERLGEQFDLSHGIPACIAEGYAANPREMAKLLEMVGPERCGIDVAGSILWSGAHHAEDMIDMNMIFGHTQQLDWEYGSYEVRPGDPAVYGKAVCIDCHRPFCLREDGVLCEVYGWKDYWRVQGKDAD